MKDEIGFLLGLAIMLTGLVGVFVPLMPGVPVMLAGAILYAAITGWDVLTWPWLLVMALLTVASIAFDFFASAWFAARLGSSRWGTAGALLGTLCGAIIFGAWGALAGGMIGAVVGEYYHGRSPVRSLRAGGGAMLGFVTALAADALVGILLLGIYLWRALS